MCLHLTFCCTTHLPLRHLLHLQLLSSRPCLWSLPCPLRSSSRCLMTRPSSWPALLFSPLDISPRLLLLAGLAASASSISTARSRRHRQHHLLLRTTAVSAKCTNVARPSRLPQQQRYHRLLGCCQHRPRCHSSAGRWRAGQRCRSCRGATTASCGARQLRSAGCLSPLRRSPVLVTHPSRLPSLAGLPPGSSIRLLLSSGPCRALHPRTSFSIGWLGWERGQCSLLTTGISPLCRLRHCRLTTTARWLIPTGVLSWQMSTKLSSTMAPGD